MKRVVGFAALFALVCFASVSVCAANNSSRDEKRKQEIADTDKQFDWWPSDAQPAPVKDPDRGGYWWWPDQPGKVTPWGNRGYIYVYKVIFDYKEDELPPPKPQELRSSLLIKKILRNVKVYFDYDKADLRDDAVRILTNAVGTLKRNPQANILISGNCDLRGSEAYNEKLGNRRADAVKQFMLTSGVEEARIKIVSHGKLNAVAPITDVVGMQKDRNAQFMIAEVEEIMLPYAGPPQEADVKVVGEGKYVEEKQEQVESEVKVSTKEYVIQKGDSLWSIAQKELGSGHRWQYLYEFNKDRIKNPNKLKSGTTIIIPVE